jgi:hypothetical protein
MILVSLILKLFVSSRPLKLEGVLLMRVILTNVQVERLRIGEIGHRMNSKVKSVKQGVNRK